MRSENGFNYYGKQQNKLKSAIWCKNTPYGVKIHHNQ